MRLFFNMQISPGVPVTNRLQRVFEILVVEHPFFAVKTRVGQPAGGLASATAAHELIELFESGKQTLQLEGDGDDPFLSFLFTKSPDFSGRISGYLVDAEVDAVIETMHLLMEVVDAYVVTVEGRPPTAHAGARRSAASDAVKARVDGVIGAHWRHYLLSGLAHRTILSDQLVEFLGAEQIAGLAPEMAWREHGRQIIAGTRDPIPLPVDSYDPQERFIIDQLGAGDAFFNPETGEPPSRISEPTTSRPIRFWDWDAGGLYTIE